MIFKDSGGLSVFWVDKMGVSTNDTSTGKYIYPNYESRHDLLQKVCKLGLAKQDLWGLEQSHSVL